MAHSETSLRRIRRCRDRCPHYRLHYGEADRRGCAVAVFCGHAGDDPSAWRALGREFLQDGACPAGRWNGEEPEKSRDAAGLQGLRDGCIFAVPEARGCANCPKVECRHPEQRGLVVREQACTSCHRRTKLSEVRIGAVITAWNEGREVRATVESLLESVEHAQIVAVVVDDGSEDGSCDGLNHRRGREERRERKQEESSRSSSSASSARSAVRVVRHEEPLGVGRSRNRGWRLASRIGCDVVSFHDAHMRFPEGALEGLAVKALQSDAVCNAVSRDIPSKGPQRGCWLHYDNAAGYGIQPKWRNVEQEAAWERVPCPMGAGYVMSARTAERLQRPTGRLWEDVAGRWGFSEQALAIKAFLLDVPVLQSRDLSLSHKYRSANPIPDASRESWKNLARATYVLLGPRVFRRRFRPWCERKLGGPDALDSLLEDVPCVPATPWWEPDPSPEWRMHDPREVFTHLLGAGAPIDEPHPEMQWLPKVERACDEVLAGHPDGRGARVLVWRPGEAMMRAHWMLPEAEIVAIERPGPRYTTWKWVCQDAGIRLEKREVGSGYTQAPDGPWDLVLIGGELQEECTDSARPVLTEWGRLLRNPTADRTQPAAEHVKAERERLAELGLDAEGRPRDEGTTTEAPLGGVEGGTSIVAATTQAAVAPPTRASASPARTASKKATAAAPLPSSASSANSAVSVCLLNWKRPENLPEVLDSIAEQTVPCRVRLWNNGDPLPEEVTGHPLVERVVRADANMGCLPRWWLAATAGTPLVCSLDDDLAFDRPDALRVAARALAEKCPRGIVGAFGWNPIAGRGYRGGRHVHRPAEDTPVQVVKGRFMLLRRVTLARVPLAVPGLEEVREDDLLLSMAIGDGRRRHLLSGALRPCFRDLPQRGASATAQPGHWASRQRAIEQLTTWLEERNDGTDS